MVIEPARTKNSPYHCFGEFQYRYIHVKERMIDGNREPVLHERDLKNRMGWNMQRGGKSERRNFSNFYVVINYT